RSAALKAGAGGSRGLARRLAQGRAIDADGVAVVADAAEQGIAESLVAEEVLPLVVVKVGGDDCSLSAVAFLHQAEEDVGLLWAEIQVSHLIDEKEVYPSKPVEQLARRAVGERGVHLIEKVLCLEEQTAVAILESLEQQARGESRFSDGGGADKDDVLRASHEVETGEAADLSAGDARLALEREGLEGPLLGERSTLDAPVEGGLLLAVPLGAQQAEQELGIGELLLLGELELVFEDL